MDKITILSDEKSIFDYQRGELGEVSTNVDQWILCCPLCKHMSIIYPKNKIIKHEDGTVSTTQPLHCHGARSRQQYAIEHNMVRRL